MIISKHRFLQKESIRWADKVKSLSALGFELNSQFVEIKVSEKKLQI